MNFNFSNNNSRQSLSHQFRFRRFAFFLSLLKSLHHKKQILDIGGTRAYWEMMNFENDNIEVLLLNLNAQHSQEKNFTSLSGDATQLDGFADKSIDVVHSNSVIEHLFTWENQQKMANEIRRVGKNYFIQTPNYYFPLEPHWVFPFFQFLPVRTRVWMTQRFNLGHIGKHPDRTAAENQVNEVKLLTKKQMQALFPEAKIYQEKILFFTKSIVAYYFPERE